MTFLSQNMIYMSNFNGMYFLLHCLFKQFCLFIFLFPHLFMSFISKARFFYFDSFGTHSKNFDYNTYYIQNVK